MGTGIATAVLGVVLLAHVVAELVGERFLAAEIIPAVAFVGVVAVADDRVAEGRIGVVDGEAAAAEQPGDTATLVLGRLEGADQRHEIGAVFVPGGAKRDQLGRHRLRRTAGRGAVVTGQGFQRQLVAVAVGVVDQHGADQTDARGDQAVHVALIGDGHQVGQAGRGVGSGAVLGDQAVGVTQHHVDGVRGAGLATAFDRCRGAELPGADGGGDARRDQGIGFIGIAAEVAVEQLAGIGLHQPGPAAGHRQAVGLGVLLVDPAEHRAFAEGDDRVEAILGLADPRPVAVERFFMALIGDTHGLAGRQRQIDRFAGGGGVDGMRLAQLHRMIGKGTALDRFVAAIESEQRAAVGQGRERDRTSGVDPRVLRQ